MGLIRVGSDLRIACISVTVDLGRKIILTLDNTPTDTVKDSELVSLTPEIKFTRRMFVAGKIKAPILALYGGKDRGIPLETVRNMEAKMTAAVTTRSRS